MKENKRIIKKAVKYLKATSDEIRLTIICMLRDGEMSVKEIRAELKKRKLKSEASLISHHLERLKKAKIVQSKRDGKCIVYSTGPLHLNMVTVLERAGAI